MGITFFSRRCQLLALYPSSLISSSSPPCSPCLRGQRPSRLPIASPQNHAAVNPPSTLIVAPVMKLPALGETSSSNAPISSSGSPKRFIGVCRMMLSIRSGSKVAVLLGGKEARANHVRPNALGAEFWAMFRVRFSTPAFDAA